MSLTALWVPNFVRAFFIKYPFLSHRSTSTLCLRSTSPQHLLQGDCWALAIMQKLYSAQKGLAYLAGFKVILGILLVLGAVQSSTAAPTNSTTLSKGRDILAPSSLIATINEAPELGGTVDRDHNYHHGHHEQHHNSSVAGNWRHPSSLAKRATPVNSSGHSPSPVGALLAKRSFVPTDAQCDAALAANGWDSSTTMFYSNANAGPWAQKLGRVLFSQKNAYGDYSSPENKHGPFFGWDPLHGSLTFQTAVKTVMSARFAERTTGKTYVVLNPDKPPLDTSLWLNVEWEILRRKNIQVFSCNANDLEEEPKQIWPPPQQGAPPPKA
jgi:hypothetical protein